MLGQAGVLFICSLWSGETELMSCNQTSQFYIILHHRLLSLIPYVWLIYITHVLQCVFFYICNVVIWNSIYSIHIYNRILGPEWERKPLWGETVRKELSPLFWKLRHIRSSNRTAFTSTLCLHCQVFTANLCLFASSSFSSGKSARYGTFYWTSLPHIFIQVVM